MDKSRMKWANHAICITICWFLTLSAHADPLQSLANELGMQQPKVSKPAPDFTLPALDGKKVSLSSYRGKLVLLHFWATWCVPCRHEMPLLHELEKALLKGLRVVCINVERNHSDKVKAFVGEVTPHFHTLLDPSGEVRNHYAVRGLPTSYLIDRKGNIVGRFIGERDWLSPAMMQLLRNE